MKRSKEKLDEPEPRVELETPEPPADPSPAAAPAAAPSPESRPAAAREPNGIHRNGSESEGWFTVQRAAQLLDIPIARIFDRIRDGKLQVRFEAGTPGESERPLVTSPELRQRSPGPGSAPAPAPVMRPPPPPPRSPEPVVREEPAREAALVSELRRHSVRLEAELREARDLTDSADEKLQSALKAVYERDVRIARMEAEVGAHDKLRQESEQFIRHLETRLDKTEERSDEKEKEIRRLAVGLGEARGEIRLLKPPAPEPPPAWKRRVASLTLILVLLAGAAAFGWVTWQLAAKGLGREAGMAAGAAGLAAFAVGYWLDRLRRAK